MAAAAEVQSNVVDIDRLAREIGRGKASQRDLTCENVIAVALSILRHPHLSRFEREQRMSNLRMQLAAQCSLTHLNALASIKSSDIATNDDSQEFKTAKKLIDGAALIKQDLVTHTKQAVQKLIAEVFEKTAQESDLTYDNVLKMFMWLKKQPNLSSNEMRNLVLVFRHQLANHCSMAHLTSLAASELTDRSLNDESVEFRVAQEYIQFLFLDKIGQNPVLCAIVSLVNRKQWDDVIFRARDLSSDLKENGIHFLLLHFNFPNDVAKRLVQALPDGKLKREQLKIVNMKLESDRCLAAARAMVAGVELNPKN